MNGILERSPCEPALELGSLRARPSGELWRIGLRVCLALAMRCADRVRTWRCRAQSRRLMALLSEHQLKDLGLTRQQAQWEMNKPFWRE